MRYLLAILMLPYIVSHAPTIEPEQYYLMIWCAAMAGQKEVILEDKSRVDCLTSQYAVEFDYAKKWSKAIALSVYYGIITGKKPGVVLIVVNPEKEMHYIQQADSVANQLGVALWWIDHESNY